MPQGYLRGFLRTIARDLGGRAWRDLGAQRVQGAHESAPWHGHQGGGARHRLRHGSSGLCRSRDRVAELRRPAGPGLAQPWHPLHRHGVRSSGNTPRYGIVFRATIFAGKLLANHYRSRRPAWAAAWCRRRLDLRAPLSPIRGRGNAACVNSSHVPHQGRPHRHAQARQQCRRNRQAARRCRVGSAGCVRGHQCRARPCAEVGTSSSGEGERCELRDIDLGCRHGSGRTRSKLGDWSLRQLTGGFGRR